LHKVVPSGLRSDYVGRALTKHGFDMIIAKKTIATTLTIMALTFGVGPMEYSPTQSAHGAPVRLARSKDEKDDKKAAPIFPDGTTFNFGKVPQGTKPKHAFRFVNNSEFPLRIVGVSTSMNPIRAWSTKGVLEPGEEAILETIVDTNRFVGPKTMTLYVQMDHGGRRREVTLWIQADSQK
jgi:Protein of unknown function (DUF1573)